MEKFIFSSSFFALGVWGIYFGISEKRISAIIIGIVFLAFGVLTLTVKKKSQNVTAPISDNDAKMLGKIWSDVTNKGFEKQNIADLASAMSFFAQQKNERLSLKKKKKYTLSSINKHGAFANETLVKDGGQFFVKVSGPHCKEKIPLPHVNSCNLFEWLIKWTFINKTLKLRNIILNGPAGAEGNFTVLADTPFLIEKGRFLRAVDWDFVKQEFSKQSPVAREWIKDINESNWYRYAFTDSPENQPKDKADCGYSETLFSFSPCESLVYCSPACKLYLRRSVSYCDGGQVCASIPTDFACVKKLSEELNMPELPALIYSSRAAVTSLRWDAARVDKSAAKAQEELKKSWRKDAAFTIPVFDDVKNKSGDPRFPVNLRCEFFRADASSLPEGCSASLYVDLLSGKPYYSFCRCNAENNGSASGCIISLLWDEFMACAQSAKKNMAFNYLDIDGNSWENYIGSDLTTLVLYGDKVPSYNIIKDLPNETLNLIRKRLYIILCFVNQTDNKTIYTLDSDFSIAGYPTDWDEDFSCWECLVKDENGGWYLEKYNSWETPDTEITALDGLNDNNLHQWLLNYIFNNHPDVSRVIRTLSRN